jgi:hypothetical protein
LELHIVFSYSAAVDVRKILAGQDASVARFSDDLSCGPINPLEPAMRRTWISDHLGYDNPDITDDEQTFWPAVFEQETSRIAWVSKRSAREYCGFLEYLRRLDGLPTQMIDTTDARDLGGEFFRTTGEISVSQILSLGLPGTVREVNADIRSDGLALWEALRADNSELRVVDGALTLASVPLSFYDEEIVSLVTSDWQPMARIVGDILERKAVDDILLFSRLYDLVDAGVLAQREAGRHPDVKRVSP